MFRVTLNNRKRHMTYDMAFEHYLFSELISVANTYAVPL